MFGTLRLCLAMSVLLSHLGLRFAGLNFGVVAVVIFFLLSGRVTAILIQQANMTAGVYYIERFFRIYPSYILTLALSVCVWRYVQPNTVFFSRMPTSYDWFANLAVIPLDLGVWTEQNSFILIPPAWSLGLELQFYLLAPWLMRCSANRYASIFVLSVAIWLVAEVGRIDTDIWGYRLLPGTLFMFLAGAAIHQRRYVTLALLWFLAVAALVAQDLGTIGIRQFNVETALGLMTGIPLIFLLSRFRRKAWDNVLGSLSYPLFLVHFPMLWLLQSGGRHPELALDNFGVICQVVAASLVASAIIYRLVERPLEPLRSALRDRRALFAQERWSLN
jgi:peptidoglycan/LPS O-acetylase OafA/YrhL